MRPLEVRLLRLLAGPGRHWTMEELKADLHASRSAIWRALTALEEAGCIVIDETEE
jgi:predicted transcriptional regulator